MTHAPSLEALRRALEGRDPDLSRLVIALARAPLKSPEVRPREGALTYQSFLQELQSVAYLRKPVRERGDWRRAQIAALEAKARALAEADSC